MDSLFAFGHIEMKKAHCKRGNAKGYNGGKECVRKDTKKRNKWVAFLASDLGLRLVALNSGGSGLDVVGGGLLIDKGGLGSGGGSQAALGGELHVDDGDNDNQPVDAVTGNGTLRGNVVPAKEGVEQSPASVVGVVGVTVVQGPDVDAGIVGTGIVGITANNLAPLVHLVGVNGLAEETGGNEKQEAGRGNEEAVEGNTAASLVNEETNQGTSQESSNSSKRNRLSFSLERNLMNSA